MLTETEKNNQRAGLITGLYVTAFPAVARFVHKMGGSLHDAKDIFHDALLIFCEKKQAPGFIPEKNETAYLLGIARHLWYRKFRELKRTKILEPALTTYLTEEDPKVSARVLEFLASSGKKCMDLLTAFYYEQHSMNELAKIFGFSSERSATVQKFKCLEKVREAIKNRSLTKHDFYE